MKITKVLIRRYVLLYGLDKAKGLLRIICYINLILEMNIHVQRFEVTYTCQIVYQ